MGSCARNPISHHFSRISAIYNDLRITDPEPVELMAEALAPLSFVTGADVGCGTGRYGIELMRRLGERLFLYFVDCSKDMLEKLKEDVAREELDRFEVVHSQAESLPLRDASLDCVLTFNAVHHFDLGRFLREAQRTLRSGGLLFIYTRFRDQNSRSVWGRYFPGFVQKETRLLDEAAVSEAIESAGGLVLRDITHFSFERAATVDCLLRRAENRHYSTFCFYEAAEFARALRQFEANLREQFDDCDLIQWVDENVLITVEKT